MLMRLLESRTVDIWDVNLAAGTHIGLEIFASVLSDDELRRAHKFRFEPDRQRYCLARFILRSLLSHYTLHAPASIRFSYGRYGKPSVTRDDSGQDIRFNVSHTSTRALFAFASGTDIGIDIENIQEGFPVMDIARAHYCESEHSLLLHSPKHERSSRFFEIWVRKEAVVKATGMGMSLDFKRFDVLPLPICPLTLSYESHVHSLTVRQVDVGMKFVAALAVMGEPKHKLNYVRTNLQDIMKLGADKYPPAVRLARVGPSSEKAAAETTSAAW